MNVKEQKNLTVQPNLLKALNKTAIRKVLRQAGEATRVEISALTGISQPTVNAIISELTAEQMVIEKGLAGSNGGRKAAVYELNTAYAHAIVMIIEPTVLICKVIDLAANICEEQTIGLGTSDKITDVILYTTATIRKTYSNIQALLIGVPGSVNREGIIYAIPDIPELEGCALGKQLASELQVSVRVMNDINATALGYVSKGRAESSHMVYLHVGRGLGAGIIADSHLLQGAGCFAGEIGFMQLGKEECMLQESFINKLGTEGYDKIARVTINIISVINPSLVVLGGSCVDKKLCKYVRDACKPRFPQKMMPVIEMCEQAGMYYERGLSRAAMEICNQDIKLV